ncbi:MAG: hypothetical protein QOF60_2738 [Actinomycetota bacterium]|jgi:hypothetical protein|nr:hypothetical protein [Actinomycetota bacterium]
MVASSVVAGFGFLKWVVYLRYLQRAADPEAASRAAAAYPLAAGVSAGDRRRGRTAAAGARPRGRR